MGHGLAPSSNLIHLVCCSLLLTLDSVKRYG